MRTHNASFEPTPATKIRKPYQSNRSGSQEESIISQYHVGKK